MCTTFLKCIMEFECCHKMLCRGATSGDAHVDDGLYSSQHREVSGGDAGWRKAALGALAGNWLEERKMADLEDVTLDGRPLQSLRVADLKAALEERGLSKSGQKNALIKRLKGVRFAAKRGDAGGYGASVDDETGWCSPERADNRVSLLPSGVVELSRLVAAVKLVFAQYSCLSQICLRSPVALNACTGVQSTYSPSFKLFGGVMLCC